MGAFKDESWAKRFEATDYECSHCRRHLPISLFNKNQRADRKRQVQGYCCDCQLKLQRERTRETQKWINTFKNVPCADCGRTFPAICMDFDHLDPTTKVASIAKMSHFGRDRILEEMAKCEIVCANCHRIRTQPQWAALRVAA